VSAIPLAGVGAIPLAGGSAIPLAGVGAIPLAGGSAIPLAGGSAIPLALRWRDEGAIPLAQRWRSIRLAVFDVDGVLTDGRLTLAASGKTSAVESKTFHVLDGHGIKQIARAGIEVAWISGRDSPVVTARARELGVTRLFQGVSDKLPVLEAILAGMPETSAPVPGSADGVPHATAARFDSVLCMGDDLADLPLMRRCAIAITVPHAPAAVKLEADTVTSANGGAGAVREVCDRLLHATGRHDLLDQAERAC